LSAARSVGAVAKLLQNQIHRRKSLMDMERAKGFEPSPENTQPAENQHDRSDGKREYAQLYAQIQGKDGRDLSHVVTAWAELPGALKAAILAIVNSATSKAGQ
jgi:hypothetical protein